MFVRKILGYIKGHPTLSHGIVGFTLFSSSDCLAQLMESAKSEYKFNKTLPQRSFLGKNERFDVHRLLSAGVIGAFLGGIVYPLAYKRLDKLWGGTDFVSVAKKSIIEIFTVGIFVNSVSIGARGLMVGHNTDDVISHVKEEMPMVTFNDARIWGPYNMIAFGFIPAYIRPATTCFMEAMWQTYISLRSNAYEKETCNLLKDSNLDISIG
jgi:Mpv17 / PMP22 family.